MHDGAGLWINVFCIYISPEQQRIVAHSTDSLLHRLLQCIYASARPSVRRRDGRRFNAPRDWLTEHDNTSQLSLGPPTAIGCLKRINFYAGPIHIKRIHAASV